MEIGRFGQTGLDVQLQDQICQSETDLDPAQIQPHLMEVGIAAEILQRLKTV